MSREVNNNQFSFRAVLKDRSKEENDLVVRQLNDWKREGIFPTKINDILNNYFFNRDSIKVKTMDIDEKLQLLLQMLTSTKKDDDKELILNLIFGFYSNDIAQRMNNLIPTSQQIHTLQATDIKVIDKEILEEKNNIATSTNINDIIPLDKKDDDEFSENVDPYAIQIK